MTGTADRPIRKFNPGTFQSDTEVTEQFVVRNHELGVLLDVLRGNIESPSCQHALTVSPRGRGKTMLLARVAAEIRTTPELARHLLPVRFMEESQEIFSLTDFWLETLFHLARECASHDSGLAEELRDRHASLSERWREQALEEHARAVVLDAADRLGRRLVLMVENLQALCKDVDQDFGWKLRGVLQTEPQIMLLASATSRFTGLDDAEQPFFEMFRIINLRPLTTEECRSLWEVVSGDRVSGREMRPLEILTGGSPRLLVIVAGFARHRSLRRLMEELVMLIDEHTEYFRGHLEVLGKTERRVYIAVLDLWQLSTPGEIAARARMDVRVVSTMLGRLVDRGALVVEGSGRKRNYAAAEPLYCIYYKLRRGRGEAAIVESLIRFMSVFYSEAERTEIFPALISEGADSPTMRPGLERAATGLPEFARFLAGIEPDRGALGDFGARADADAPDYDSIERLLRKISTASNQEAFDTVVDIVDRSVTIQNPAPHRVSQAFAAWALNMQGDAHAQLGDTDSAFSAYDAVVERFGNDEDVRVQGLVARALVSTGDVCGELCGLGSGLSAYDEVVERFDGSKDSWLQGWVARALNHKGHAQREMGELDLALSVYEEVLERFRGNKHEEPQRNVADALVWQGHLQEQLGKPDLALAAYEEVAERFSASEDIELKRCVAHALHLKGDCLRELGNLDSALSIYEEIVKRFADNPDLQMQRDVARALTGKGYMRLALDKPALALSACEEVTKRFSSSEDVELNRWVAEALTLRGDTLQAQREFALAVSTCDEIVERFDDKSDVEIQRWVANALTSKGYVEAELGDLDSAVSTYEEVIQRFGATGHVELERCVAVPLHRKGVALLDMGHPESALAAFDEFLERFGSSEYSQLHQWVAMTLVNKGDALRKLDQLDLAVSAYGQVVDQFGSSKDATVLWLTCGALARMGRALRKSGDLGAAVATCDEIVTRFGTSEDPELWPWVALATIDKTEMLIETGRTQDALRTCEEFESRLRDLDHERKRELTWQARQVWTRALLAQQDLPAATEKFRSLHAAFVPTDDTMMGEASKLIPEMIAGGASAHELLGILSSNADKAAALAPLVVALRQHTGEIVREPEAILQVAADIRKRIQEAGRRKAESTKRAIPDT